MELLENQRRRVKSMKPKCKLVGENGNIFNLMGIAARTLKELDLEKKPKKW